MTIGELYDICSENTGLDIIAIVGNKEFGVSSQFWVEDEWVYYFKADEEYESFRQATGSDIVNGIEKEAEDECWNPCGFRDKNTYEDCGISFINGTNFDDQDGCPDYDVLDCYVTGNAIKLLCK